MIGIDLVAYEQASSSRWAESRFQEKVLNDSEKELLHQAPSTFHQFWEFWSVKEAAFKSESHTIPNTHFHPKKYTCLPNNQVISSVTGRTFNYKTDYSSDYLTSIVTSSDCETTSRSFEIHNSTPPEISKSVRHATKDELRNHWGLELEMNQPLQYGQLDLAQGKCCFVSMSHHGSYGAFAIARKKDLLHA